MLARDDDYRAEITNRSKAQTSKVTAGLMLKDDRIIRCRDLRRRLAVYTGRRGLTGAGRGGVAARVRRSCSCKREKGALGFGTWRNVTSGRGGREIRLPGPASESARSCRRSQWPGEVASGGRAVAQ